MGQNELLIGVGAAAVAVIAYAGNVGGFKAWADSLMKGGGTPPGNVPVSCDQLCTNKACATFKVYCKGSCPACTAASNQQKACQTLCASRKLVYAGLTSSGACSCVPPRPLPLGKVYPHPYLTGVSCYRQMCGAKAVSWCVKGTAAQVVAAWKANACKSASQAYAYPGFDNVTIA